MAIPEESLYPDTDRLVSTSKKFYPISIPVSHWQLRHYISSPEPDRLYYASGREVFCLQPSTKKRKHIASLPFEARCTASGYGWICVGGEDEGHFAAIKTGALGWGEEGATSRAADVKVDRIGVEIVNSISIHRIQDEDAHLDDIVAVLTNNDKTVRVYSLPLGLETCCLDLPFAMNHATISPDGKVLVAVGDVNSAYFFRRHLRSGKPVPGIQKPHNRLNSGSVEWRLTNIVNLHVTNLQATMGYFTTAWSPSGRLVAVGSESGYITVLDVELLARADLDDEDAIVIVRPGSRPDIPPPHPGAVRSMVFSPDPWDLLIWAEDQGRVCVGDLRTGLRQKQVILMDPSEEGLTTVRFADAFGQSGSGTPTSSETQLRHLEQMEMDLLRRYRRAQENPTAVNFATEYIDARRRQRQHRQELASLRSQNGGLTGSSAQAAVEDDPQGLTLREQEVLNTLRMTRQREEARANGTLPQTVNYTSPDMFLPARSSGSRSHTPHPAANPAARPISEILSSMSDTNLEGSSYSDMSHGLPRPTSVFAPGSPDINAWAANSYRTPDTSTSGNTTGLTRQSDGSRIPRRRASVILSPPATSASDQPSTATRPRPTPPPLTPPASDDPPEQEESSADHNENPWRTISDAMALARGPLFESASLAPPIPPHPTTNSTPPPPQQPSREQTHTTRSLARQRERWRTLSGGDSQATSPVATGANTTALPRPSVAEGYEYERVLRRMRGSTSGGGRRLEGVRSAGVAVSADGRWVWVGCEEGVFEVEVNRQRRLGREAREWA
nr:hypothetical protein B0A51_18370 [Rachicladosporium sp. CCFEE 5018]OQO20228.1 hypothetical protein B0A51_17253 [Rachicladosporium sp. CCFEE 5018]